MTEIDLAALDRDGALGEAHATLFGSTRAQLLQGAGLGAAALLLADAEPVLAARSRKRDRAILNYALLLEHLQADFYTEAEGLHGLSAQTARQATVVGAHERAHVRAFKGVLGRSAIAKPSFDFGAVTARPDAFRRTAVAFEDLAVAAYGGQIANIEAKPYLVVALSVLTVEARHASWIRRLAGQAPAARPFDAPRSAAGVRRIVAATRFVRQTAPRTSSRRKPRYTG